MNAKPHIPTLDYPSDGAVAMSRTPTLQTTSSDAIADYLQYKIQICKNAGMTLSCSTYTQPTSLPQAGWSGQDASSGSAYASGTQAKFTIPTQLDPNTTYYWRSYAIDPAGSNTYSSTQTPFSFTTEGIMEATECRIDESNDKTSFTLLWNDRASGEDGYEVQRSVNGGAWSVLATSLPANTQTYIDNTISFASSYSYRIAPYKNPGVDANTRWCVTSTLLPDTGIFRIN
jgi:hypothetical protein